MTPDREKVRRFARDLRTQEPRPAHLTLAGLPMAARTLDKCRAALLGMEGEFRFGCPMDQEFFKDAGVSRSEFNDLVSSGASDAEVESWLEERQRSKV